MAYFVKMNLKLLVVTIALNLAIASGFTTVASSESKNIKVRKNTCILLKRSRFTPRIMFEPPEEGKNEKSENSRGGASRAM